MARTNYLRWDDDGVCFVLYQYTKFDFYSDKDKIIMCLTEKQLYCLT
jgi:hypothetical protein